MDEQEICELPDWRLDDGCVEVRELAVPDMAAASARAFAALKLFRLFSRCPNGNVGIPAFVSAEIESLDFPADNDRLGEPFCDFIPAEPADAGRALAFSDIVSSQSFRSNPRPEFGCNTSLNHHRKHT